MSETFGDLVRRARKARDMTLDALGDAAGGDHGRMSRIERGLVRPTAREVHAIVSVLELDAEAALRLAADVVPAGAESEGRAA